LERHESLAADECPPRKTSVWPTSTLDGSQVKRVSDFAINFGFETINESWNIRACEFTSESDILVLGWILVQS
jgi:hypothetical protein